MKTMSDTRKSRDEAYMPSEEQADAAVPAGPMVVVSHLSHDYVTSVHTVHALRDVNLTIERGEMVAVRGRSGSGKTTLLNLVGGLDRPTAGTVEVDGGHVSAMGEGDLVRFRRRKVGFVFQSFGLIPILTAAENLEIPLRMIETEPGARRDRVDVLLDLVGLSERAEHRPHELSGGEQQRIGIARALANSPSLLLADEPTGQLDSKTGRSIMNLIRSVVRSEGATAVVATHDPALIDLADRVIDLLDGKIVRIAA
jgi:putative ABC transport system ATP-binding protein